ncbi:class I SAM-dependent methyltransferase [uncultured Methanomethylovorans sp.]|uniref:class I SAM-dependent methyltransferase n=1 Tax=uncultured Methanomethylovorans sp. TaxID=183759 RepID=UPI002AA6A76B|nr:class I SAM-dependent methyltransferase [uncultured Methanomethylovorans sp.]
MAKQNIFDDNVFFEGYYKLRENIDSANNLVEKPAIFSMIGDVKGRSIIDLGCGYGENCKTFSDMGAKRIVGVDISVKMLEVARNENFASNIEYYNICMEDVDSIRFKYDVAVSSLAIHYIMDFNKLAMDVYSLLNDNGIFVFSQEHPLSTAPIDGAKWIKDSEEHVDHYRLTDYARLGERNISWIVDGIIKYHCTFSEIINGLILAGFKIEEIREPVPREETIQRLPDYEKDLHKPDFLIIKVRKKNNEK